MMPTYIVIGHHEANPYWSTASRILDMRTEAKVISGNMQSASCVAKTNSPATDSRTTSPANSNLDESSLLFKVETGPYLNNAKQSIFKAGKENCFKIEQRTSPGFCCTLSL